MSKGIKIVDEKTVEIHDTFGMKEDVTPVWQSSEGLTLANGRKADMEAYAKELHQQIDADDIWVTSLGVTDYRNGTTIYAVVVEGMKEVRVS